jgi:hypothetical protein
MKLFCVGHKTWGIGSGWGKKLTILSLMDVRK